MRKALLALALSGLTSAATAQTANVEILARTCNGCHGVDGVSAGLSMPSIGGLPKDYLRRVMKQWKYGERSGITMNRIVKGLSDDEIDGLAAYFAKRSWVPAPQQASAEVLSRGEFAASDNCADCHGSTGGDPDVDAPRINGQWGHYMNLELDKYRSGEFKMPHRRMKKALQDSTPADASAAARYYGVQSR
jgi:sulfide dehydrogenase cytochrome subunit